jgi:glycosyltransferase involved in cell wall biosynthesis
MIFIVHSETNEATIEENLGQSEYSYHFVLKEFRPILQQLGKLITVIDPEHEVDDIYRSAARAGEACVFLSFSPPHQTSLDLACPTVPVFAWEFDTIPNETWYGDPSQDWRFVLNKLGRAITHSGSTVTAVKQAIGADFPICSIPAPVWDRFASLSVAPSTPVAKEVALDIPGTIFDSRTADLSIYSPEYPEVPQGVRLRKAMAGCARSTPLQLDGIVYTSIFNPYDARKNCFDMICAFCLAFRDVDATLILKLIHTDTDFAVDYFLSHLYRLTPFRCRVILIKGFITDAEYLKLMQATCYVVNTSHGEGQCLPLMEYMSCGKPAVAPRHSAMLDYISPENAFVIDSSAEPSPWYNDPRHAYRTLRQRIDFETLLTAYRESYRVANEEPDRYAAMSVQARRSLEQYCSSAVVSKQLQEFLAKPPRPALPAPSYGEIRQRDISYSFGTTIDFTNEMKARRYLLAGWHNTEVGRGIWSDGPIAELAFRFDRTPKGIVVLRVNLSALISEAHRDIKVTVVANGTAVALWRFNVVQPTQISRSWREAVVPANLVRENQLRVALRIEHPASPAQLGIALDSRSLGIMLHKLSMWAMRSRARAVYASKTRASKVNYELGRVIDFAGDLEARRYLVAGWGTTDVGQGVWTDGPVAELSFRIADQRAGPLVLRARLSAFVNRAHPGMEVDVWVNGQSIARWLFGRAHREEDKDFPWREATIPRELVANGDVDVALKIEHPVSPAQLGLSMDARLLGIMIQELSIATVGRGVPAVDAAVIASGKVDYELGRVLHFAKDPDARRYLLAGWSFTGWGQDIWSDGRVAELGFRIAQERPRSVLLGRFAQKSLKLRVRLSALINEVHPAIGVDVRVNGVNVARWLFEHARPADKHPSSSWREAKIPAESISNGGIHVVLKIENPVSPVQLGMSKDARLLAIMIHELSISPPESRISLPRMKVWR